MASFEQVPDDVVLNHIFCRLLDIITRVRFAAVCRSWRSLAKSAPPVLTPACLIMMHDPDAATSTDSVPSLFDPISASIHRLPLPREAIWERLMAGFHGPYLAYSSRTPNFLLYNPFSGKTLHQFPRKARYPDGRREIPGTHLCNAQFYSPPHPTADRLCLVAAIGDHDSCIRICYISDQDIYHKDDDGDGNDNNDDNYEWVVSAPIVGVDQRRLIIDDLIFYKGELYCIAREGGSIFAFDLHRHVVGDGVISCPTPRTVYNDGGHFDTEDYWPYRVDYHLVESNGDLLVVTQYFHPCAKLTPKVMFDVHRLDVEEGTLAPVEDLGDTMLLLGRGCSMSSWRGSEPGDQFFRKNFIYFFDYCKPPFEYRYRLGRCRVGSTPWYPAEFLPQYPLPTLHSPLWITTPPKP